MTTASRTHSNIDTDTFTAYSDSLQAAALTTTRLAATSLPADLSFHRSIDPALARDVDAFSNRVLVLANKLVHIASGKSSRIQEEDVLDEFVRNIVDPMEDMLESTDGALDLFLGKRKEPAIHVPAVPVDPHQKKPKKQPFRGRLDPALTHASHIPKPQVLFKHTLSNTDESPYIPATLIPHKWCAKVPLGYVFHDEISNQGVGDVRDDDDDERERKRALHPYYYELTHPSYPDHVFTPTEKPSLPSPLEIPSSGVPTSSPSLTFISTPKVLLAMANAISSVTELAVDLEHHSYRSYKGFLALMQISTRQGDFIVDLLVPEVREGLRQAKGKAVGESEEARMASEAGSIIASVFADPSIIKVFHGAESDIVWLQQDFNIFVVGLFDTFHASKLLELPKLGLAHLLETYCDFIPDKRYQLADWRIRPLPAEMSTYAHSDTHFLLYIYDMLRLSLIERQTSDSAMTNETGPLIDAKQAHYGHPLIHGVLARSARTALRLYENEVYDSESGTGSSGWDTLARKWNKVGLIAPLTPVRGTEVHAAVYKAVHRWREDAARGEDESIRYVLPTHHLFLLAERLPTTIPDMLSLFGGPGGVSRNIPPVLKRRAGELLAVIEGAVEATKSTFSPQGSTEDRRQDDEIRGSTAVEESEVITLSSSATKATHESRLWTIASSSIPPTISCSSLFSIGISEERVQKKGVAPRPPFNGEDVYLAKRSMLFGSALTKVTAVSSPRTAKSTFTHAEDPGGSAERFKDLVEKIHRTLVIAPVVSMPPSAATVLTEAVATSLPNVPVNSGVAENKSALPDEPDIPAGPVGQIEIPFVPAHKRQTLTSPLNYEHKDDMIVVVGHAGTRQRKRKRDKAGVASTSRLKSGAQLGGAEASASIGDHDQEMDEFDYSTVPNLLDDEGERGAARGVHEEDEKRKKKQRHGKGTGLFEYGNFRAPPRDQREVRSGNKTHTFR